MIEPEKQIVEVKTKPNTRGLYKDYEKLQDKYSKIKLENKHYEYNNLGNRIFL